MKKFFRQLFEDLVLAFLLTCVIVIAVAFVVSLSGCERPFRTRGRSFNPNYGSIHAAQSGSSIPDAPEGDDDACEDPE